MRLAAGLLQSDIGKILGVSYVQVGRIERGLSKLSTDHVQKLLPRLGVEVADLLVSQQDQVTAQLHSLAKRMTLSQQRQWLAVGQHLLVGSSKVIPLRPGSERRRRGSLILAVVLADN